MMKSLKRESTELELAAKDFFLGPYELWESLKWGTPEHKKARKQYELRKETLLYIAKSNLDTELEIDGVKIRLMAREAEVSGNFDWSTYCEVVVQLSGALNGIVQFSGESSSWYEGTLGEAFYENHFTEVKPKTITKVIFEAV